MSVSYYSSYGNKHLYNMDSYGLNSHIMAASKDFGTGNGIAW
jgi:hypothetical protein